MPGMLIPFPLNRAVPIYRIKVTIADTRPAVWRRLLVRGNVNLGQFHAILQVGVGWTNSHLHRFTIDRVHYSIPDMEKYTGEKGGAENEREFSLMEILPKAGSSFQYEYDFGDSWLHVLVVERILPPDEQYRADACCIDGARACPPENCGGVPGYDRLLKVIRNPRHPDYVGTMELPGGEFDPETFDIDRINKSLRKLVWEHPTVD